MSPVIYELTNRLQDRKPLKKKLNKKFIMQNIILLKLKNFISNKNGL